MQRVGALLESDAIAPSPAASAGAEPAIATNPTATAIHPEARGASASVGNRRT
jgi:hypothetical protein